MNYASSAIIIKILHGNKLIKSKIILIMKRDTSAQRIFFRHRLERKRPCLAAATPERDFAYKLFAPSRFWFRLLTDLKAEV
jgi:hypothetical protein